MAVLSTVLLVIAGLHISWRMRVPIGARPGRRLRMLLAASMLIVVMPSQGSGQVRENEVKATLLFNFCHFVEWPRHAFEEDSTPFVIGILGEDPFGRIIDDLVQGEKTHGRAIVVRRYRRVEEITQVHLLYVSASEQGRVRRVISLLKGRPMLTVGEGAEPGFTHFGGSIEFTTDRGNIKLRVNLDEVREAGLVMSAKLLQVSEVVRTQN